MSQNQKQNINSIEQIQASNSSKLQNMSDSIQPSQQIKKDTGIIQSHTNYTNEKNQSEPVQLIRQISDSSNNTDKVNQNEEKTLEKVISEENKEVIEEIIKKQIKKQEVSIQVGSSKRLQVLKNTQETYAPESCEIHQVTQNKKQALKISPQQQIKEDSLSQNHKKSQVQIQVGVSLLDEPEKVIHKAKTQRILSDQDRFIKFLQNVKILTQNQKSVLFHIQESIQKRKAQILTWNDILKNNFVQYAVFVKDFYEQAQKKPKQQKSQQLNKYLNIGQQLKDGYAHLLKFRQDSGQNYRGMHQYIYCKTIADLQRAYKKYGQQMKQSQNLVKDKKKACLKIQEQFKQQGSKIKKMFNRIKQNSKQQHDFFIQISKLINLERQYRQALIQWGKQIVQLRKSLINNCEYYANDIQIILNGFKTQSNSLYGIQKVKYDKIINSRKQIIQQSSFSKLILLVDSDYIRSSLESVLKKQVPVIDDKVFQLFVQVPQAKQLYGDPKQLVNNLIVKSFALKDTTQQLISTVSGNLVLYNRQSLECSEKMSVKHIKDATAIENGVIQVQQKVPGIIFDSKRKITIDFKDADRAEELMCYLGQGETSNN